jgi:ATP-dependent exoDNAse (exonuclease V) beta subunit
VDAMMKKRSWPTSPYFGKTKEEILKQWDDSAKESQQQGTKLHADIETFYKGGEVINTSTEYRYFQQFVKDVPLQPYQLEWRIYNEDHKIVGTLDMVARNADGTLDLYDWKRSKHIETVNHYNKMSPLLQIPDTNYWHYILQLNLYKFILETNYNETIRDMYIVCFHPNNLQYVKYKLPVISLSEVLKQRILSITGHT